MRKILALLLVLSLSAMLFAGGNKDAAQKEVRVLLANHPYGDLLKTAIPEFEKQTGIKVVFESLAENQLTQKLTTEFATNSSTVDVFMTRPLQEALLFNKNNWYAALDAYDFSDYPSNTVDIGRKAGKPYVVPIITEWQVMYYRKDLLEKAGLSVPTNFTELENAARVLNTGGVAGIGARGAGDLAVTQASSYLYNFGARYLENNVAVFDTPEAIEAFRYYGRLIGSYGPEGVTAFSWNQLEAAFQAGRLAIWTDASVFLGDLLDPTMTQVPKEAVAVAKLPAGPKADSPFIVVSWAIAISNNTKNLANAMEFLKWATSKEMALEAMKKNIPMARNSVWDDAEVKAMMDPGLLQTRAHASQNGYPYDRPFMSSVGEARNLIGEIIIESINTKGASNRIPALAAEKTNGVNDLLKADGEYGGN